MASSGVPPGPPKALHQPNAPSIARAADRPLCNPGYTSSARRVLPLVFVTPVQVSKAMNRERYRPDAIGGSLRFQKVDDGWSDTKSSYQELGDAGLLPRSRNCISRFHHFCSSLVPANDEHPIDAGGRHRTDD